jgi:transcriptional regulator with XRE-family HTH domain
LIGYPHHGLYLERQSMSAMTSSAAPLAARVRDERLRVGWTQADLANRAGMSVDTYVRFERSAKINLGRLLKVTTALGFDLTLSASGTAPSSPSLPDPRLVRVRQRGLRHARPASAPSTPSKTPASGSRPKPTGARPPAPLPARATLSVDPSAVAEATKQYRDPIRMLVNTIVFNRLNNYTTRTVVQNVMSAHNVPDSAKPAFVAAVEAEIAGLNAENCIALSINPSTYETWAKTWNYNLGIVGALE